MFRRLPRPVAVLVLTLFTTGAAIASGVIPNLFTYDDPTGGVSTYSTNGALRKSNPFFQSLGTNGRSCATCHVASAAFGLSAAEARARFAVTRGRDPLFVGLDGANCPDAPRRDVASHSLILGNGLLRIALTMPPNADFTVDTVRDPYGCDDVEDATTGVRTLSMYRRPLPSTNLRFVTGVMWDGRETVAPLGDPGSYRANLLTDLRQQALDATLGHAQASRPPSDAQLAAIVDFEVHLYSAQSWDTGAGLLQTEGASGGPMRLAHEDFWPGINDPLGDSFDAQGFSLFDRWADLPRRRPRSREREEIAAGEAIFNTAPLTITDVSGFNDALGEPAIAGTCSTCHNTPNVGSHSTPLPIDIGVGHVAAFESDPNIVAALSKLSMPNLPVYKVTCTGEDAGAVAYTTDLGKAMLSGQCADVGRLKGPVLRGLAARAPYFHNGAAATLREVVEFYNARFQMNLTERQKRQLVAFLQSL
jgi:cytochrome c peroxidase